MKRLRNGANRFSPQRPEKVPGRTHRSGAPSCFALLRTLFYRGGYWGFLGVFLAVLTLPRFGVVWHRHTDADRLHAYQEILQLLAEHAAQHDHTGQHGHSHPDARGIFLADASTDDLHGHYYDDSLVAFYTPLQVLWVVIVQVGCRGDAPRAAPRQAILLLNARAPPLLSSRIA